MVEETNWPNFQFACVLVELARFALNPIAIPFYVHILPCSTYICTHLTLTNSLFKLWMLLGLLFSLTSISMCICIRQKYQERVLSYSSCVWYPRGAGQWLCQAQSLPTGALCVLPLYCLAIHHGNCNISSRWPFKAPRLLITGLILRNDVWIYFPL